jgi:hypothetical protein
MDLGSRLSWTSLPKASNVPQPGNGGGAVNQRIRTHVPKRRERLYAGRGGTAFAAILENGLFLGDSLHCRLSYHEV